jgi:putative transposase
VAFSPIVYFDALQVKIRDESTVQNKAVYLALGVNMEGEKELLGLWIAQNEVEFASISPIFLWFASPR